MDCLIIGAGSAGATAAVYLASKGLKVVVVDKRPRARSGARWINAIEDNLFDELDLGVVPDDVFAHSSRRFVITTEVGNARSVIDRPRTHAVHMRPLNKWLIELAEEEGATFRFDSEASVGAWDGAEREVHIGGRKNRVPLVIDATGFRLPDDRGDFSHTHDACTAYQATYRIDDRAAAGRWLARHRVDPGDTLSIASVEGGWSVLNVMVGPKLESVELLTGTMFREHVRPSVQVAKDFLRDHTWVGRRRYGGGRLIPLRPLTESFVDDGVMYVGDCVGQVFPQHGSGVAAGMRAAAMAADVGAAAVQLGDTRVSNLWSYNSRWQRSRGAVHAFYQPIRYVTSSFSPEQTHAMIAAGLIGGRGLRAALSAEVAPVDLSVLPRAVLHIAELAPLLPRLVSTLGLSQGIYRHYRAFPKRGPVGDYDTWLSRARLLMRQARNLSLEP